MKPVKMIESWEAENIREKFALNRPPDFGVIEAKIGTGRATCRECGEKIAKGKNAILFCYDFTGSGSWTAVEIQIHTESCKVTEGK